MIELVIYMAIISAMSVFLTLYDKMAAKKQKSRISEKNLFMAAILGGAFAMYTVMKLIRHKTLHKRFMLGLPLLFVLHLLILIVIFEKLL